MSVVRLSECLVVLSFLSGTFSATFPAQVDNTPNTIRILSQGNFKTNEKNAPDGHSPPTQRKFYRPFQSKGVSSARDLWGGITGKNILPLDSISLGSFLNLLYYLTRSYINAFSYSNTCVALKCCSWSTGTLFYDNMCDIRVAM